MEKVSALFMCDETSLNDLIQISIKHETIIIKRISQEL